MPRQINASAILVAMLATVLGGCAGLEGKQELTLTEKMKRNVANPPQYSPEKRAQIAEKTGANEPQVFSTDFPARVINVKKY